MENGSGENDCHNKCKEQVRKMAPGGPQVAMAVGGTRGEKPGGISDSHGGHVKGQKFRKRKATCTLVTAIEQDHCARDAGCGTCLVYTSLK